MNSLLRNTLAILGGFILGSIVNMFLLSFGGILIPPPEGTDTTTMEGLKAALPLFEPQHYIFPFLAHALGTFAGALFAAFIAASHKFKFAMAIGFLFLAGGIANVIMLPSPLWYTIVDIGGAYLPFAYVAGKIITKRKAISAV
jgi:hypothetical protein